MSKSTALVTGASSGIGLEFARLLAADGYDLILAARSVERLADIASALHRKYGVRVGVSASDLSDPAAARQLWDELANEGTVVDTLVNNAGVGLHGSFVEQRVDAIDRLVALNIATLTTLTRLALPDMVARQRGRILNVASLVAYQPGGPGQAVYYATKSFVLSFSKGLGRELRGSGVSVTALCPGPTTSRFEENSGATGTILYRWMPTMRAVDVARAGYRGMTRGSSVVIPGLLAKLMAIAGELPPRRLALEVNRFLLRDASRAS